MRQRKLFPTTLLNPFSEQLATKPRESILRVDGNESVEARGHAEGAVKAAADVQRGSPSASFGQSQRESRNQEERRQTAALRKSADKITLSGEFVANEGEHLVHRDEVAGLAHKSTNNLPYGLVLDQDAWKPHRKLSGRPALPSEYLWRLGLQNAVFEDAIKLMAIGKENGEPCHTAKSMAPFRMNLSQCLDTDSRNSSRSRE